MRACPECDLLHEIGDLKKGHVGVCQRCGATLFRHQPNSLDRSLAFAITGIVFFLVANLFPILVFEMNGNMQINRLVDGAIEFLNSAYWSLGILVLISSVLAPFLVLLLLISILLPLKLGKIPYQAETQIRTLEHVKPWAMAEIFILGIVVAFVKLGDYADVDVGLSLFAFVLTVLATMFAYLSLDGKVLWIRLEQIRRDLP